MCYAWIEGHGVMSRINREEDKQNNVLGYHILFCYHHIRVQTIATRFLKVERTFFFFKLLRSNTITKWHIIIFSQGVCVFSWGLELNSKYKLIWAQNILAVLIQRIYCRCESNTWTLVIYTLQYIIRWAPPFIWITVIISITYIFRCNGRRE